MPNHVKNLLKIEGEERILKFISKCISGSKDDQYIDFDRIIPAPAFCFNSSAGKYEEDLAEELGCAIWTSFNRQEWGTKWNAYNQSKVSDNEYLFETAWSCAHKIAKAIADKFDMVKVTLTFADEDWGSNAGILECS